ncbi:MAG: HU family DNA-binding protein [Akkermansiaceae bacterium]|nr:HU family DNA-binding protein [Akkermansiaceae bacterium]
MNKKELLARVQRYMGPGTTHSTASAAVEAVLGSILDLTQAEGQRLRITRFGAFERVRRPARQAFCIPAGQPREVAAHSRLIFTPARGFPERPL